MRTVIEILFGSGIIISLITLYFQSKETYIKNINSHRNASNKEFRNAMSKIIAICRLKADENEKFDDKKYEFYQSIIFARMCLSIYPERIGNCGHGILDEKLKVLLYDKEKMNEKEIEELIFISKQILSYEWNRVKNEAKGEV